MRSTDTITGSGLEIAGNNKDFAHAGRERFADEDRASGALRRALAIAWSPTSKLTVRTGFGMYYDRGEFFSLSVAQRGRRFQRTVRRDAGAAVRFADLCREGRHFQRAVRDHRSGAPPGSAAAFQALLPNLCQTASDDFPPGNLFGPFLFGGYDINNKLPYSENWTFDLQYQAANNWLFSAGYVGNHGAASSLADSVQPAANRYAANPVNGQTLLLWRRPV